MNDVRYIDRESGQIRSEKIFGDGFLRWLYATGSGRSLQGLLTRKGLSHLYGHLQNRPQSRHRITSFVSNFEIPMEEFLPPGPRAEDAYLSFNDFFRRAFLPGKRPFVADPEMFPAPAEGRYAAYPSLEGCQQFVVKGHRVDKISLLGNAEIARSFEHGPVVIVRLCPSDYHRFHFFDDGCFRMIHHVPGRLHSVGLRPLASRGDILIVNDRQVSLLDTAHFGLVAMIEIGALCVGTIRQVHNPKERYRRGAEKGYFLFGGSTVILLGEKGAWTMDEDLVHNTQRGFETLVKLGTRIARKGSAVPSGL